MAYRIYLVDDDRFLLDLYAVKFKNAGHAVSVFGSGKDLLLAIRKEVDTPPDAILLDLIMPEMSGFETLEIIRKEKLVPDAKLIVLSNQGQDADIEMAKKLSVNGYITKASSIPSEVFSETIRIIESGSSGDKKH